jgi:hypothetical protein
MPAATLLSLLVPLALGETAAPCADSTASAPGFWHEATLGPAPLEPCDVEEYLLFPPEEPPSTRAAERASFSLEHSAGRGLAATTRHQARRGGWSHRLEIRDEAGGEAARKGLSRRELAWSGGGWTIAGGDLSDADLPAWPRGLPRRALPSGWQAARAADLFPYGAPPRLQGLAAGVTQASWSAHAVRAWNPVESGREPAWSRPWILSHSAAAVARTSSQARPWTTALHVSETRVARGDADSLSERMAAARVTSPGERWAALAALLETRDAPAPAWALGFDGSHRFPAGRRISRVEGSVRQRGAGWISAWDPAVPKNSRPAPGIWGAGEYRLASTLDLAEALTLKAENWSSWNPAARAGRKGLRASFTRRLEDFRLRLDAVRRESRAASGSVSLHRAIELEGASEENPRWRARAWRSWNAGGPVATGLFVGAEPVLDALRARAGCALEVDRADRLEGTATGGFTWSFARGWNLDAGAALPWGGAEGARWRATLNFQAVQVRPENSDH